MTNLVSQKTNNYQFAPGISLYGVDGKDGKSGISGTSIFISQYQSNNNDDINTFISCIRQGRSTALGPAEYIGRSYMSEDSFLFPNGYIYKIIDINQLIQAGDTINTENFDQFFEFVGRIIIDNEDNGFVESNERLVLDTNNYKGFVINVSQMPDSELSDIKSPMTIISDKISDDETIKFIDLKSIQSGQSDVQFRIQYDTNNKCFIIESDNPILVNSDLEVAYTDTNSSITYDEYSKVYTADSGSSEGVLTTFRSICENIKWTKQSDEIHYEFEPENSTNQIYYSEKLLESGIDPNGNVADIVELPGFNTWKYSMIYTPFKRLGETRKYKKVKFQFFLNTELLSADDSSSNGQNGSLDENIIIQFRDSDKQILGRNITKLESKEYDGHNGKMYTTDYIYVPSDVSEMWISAPKEYFYIIVYGAYNELIEIDSEKEEEKIGCLVNGETVYFPIDALKFATLRYDTKFKIKNNNSQSVYKLPKTAMFHFVGKLNIDSEEGYDATIVDREYYYAIPNDSRADDFIEPGHEAYITLSSYNDPSNVNWTVSVIGQTEFIIKYFE